MANFRWHKFHDVITDVLQVLLRNKQFARTQIG